MILSARLFNRPDNLLKFMKKKLFVSNLDFEITTEQLREMFVEVGAPLSVVIATDRDTRRSKGFAFVEMENEEEATRAIESLNNRMVNNRPMKVVEDRGKGGGGAGGEVREAGSENNRRQEFLPPIQRMQLFKRRRKMDPFMSDPTKSVDFKDVATLSRFLSERGKILSRRLTGLNAYNQRKVSKAIKRAQQTGLLPFTSIQD